MDRLTADGISWAPSRRIFLRRIGIIAAITFAALAGVALAVSIHFELPQAWAFLFAGTITLGFMLDDLMRWRNVHGELWQISEGQLIHDGPEGRSQIPLSDIVSAKVQFRTRVVIKLTSGQRMLMRYLPYASATAKQIEAARGPLRP